MFPGTRPCGRCLGDLAGGSGSLSKPSKHRQRHGFNWPRLAGQQPCSKEISIECAIFLFGRRGALFRHPRNILQRRAKDYVLCLGAVWRGSQHRVSLVTQEPICRESEVPWATQMHRYLWKQLVTDTRFPYCFDWARMHYNFFYHCLKYSRIRSLIPFLFGPQFFVQISGFSHAARTFLSLLLVSFYFLSCFVTLFILPIAEIVRFPFGNCSHLQVTGMNGFSVGE